MSDLAMPDRTISDEDARFMCLAEDDGAGQPENQVIFEVEDDPADPGRRVVKGEVPRDEARRRASKEGLVLKGFAGEGKVWRKSETVAGQVDGPLVLSVAFLDGDAALRRETLRIAGEWCGAGRANIRLMEAPASRADIRVTFASGLNQSAVGSDATAGFFSGKPTMHLSDARLVFGTATSRTLRVVRHEFGHALGLSHEHQHPEAPFVFHFDRVVDAHLGLQWGGCAISRAECEASVRRNITERADMDDLDFVTADFDRDSVMLYPLVDGWLASGGPARDNIAISALDLALARRMYP